VKTRLKLGKLCRTRARFLLPQAAIWIRLIEKPAKQNGRNGDFVA